MILALLFLIGCFLGSFIGVLSDRLSRGEQVVKGRSRCEFCNHTLSTHDLIPILSYILLGGQCRYCKRNLSPWYIGVEVGSGIILASTWLWSLNQPLPLVVFVLYSILFLTLWALFIADFRYGILPDALVGLCIIVAILIKLTPLLYHPLFVTVSRDLMLSTIVGIGASIVFIGIDRVTQKFLHKHGMGMGDVKLVFFIGLLLGFTKTLIGIYLAFLTGGLLAVILIMGGSKKFGQQLAFGPFLIVGTVVMVVWGDFIIKWLQGFMSL